MGRETERKDLKCEIKKYTYGFQQYKTIRPFGESIYTCKASIVETEYNQSNLLEKLREFNNKPRPKNKDKKIDTYESAYALDNGRELTRNGFKSGIFPIKLTQDEGRPSDVAIRLKTLTPKQMLQRLPTALAQVKAGDTSENLLNEIRQIIHYQYRAKGITQNVYKCIIQNEYYIYEF